MLVEVEVLPRLMGLRTEYKGAGSSASGASRLADLAAVDPKGSRASTRRIGASPPVAHVRASMAASCRDCRRFRRFSAPPGAGTSSAHGVEAGTAS